MKNNKIGILHYRIGKTDGVSLEIKKRKAALESMGYVVKLIAGPIQENTDYLIPYLEFDSPEVLKIRHNAFEKFEDFKNETEFESCINEISHSIKNDFLEIHKIENFNYLFIHNVFTHGRHIASAKAFYEIAKETDIKIISVNHDFYWVGSYAKIYKPTTPFVTKFLEKYSPPTLPQITHVTINTINQRALKEKIKRDSILLPDTFDFDQQKWAKDDFNSDFLKNIGISNNDLVVLQATRITKRKGIELAIDFVAKLTNNISLLINRRLYNRKLITKDSKVVLVLAGYAEKDSLLYKSFLEKRIKQSKIKALFISDIIGAERKKVGKNKIYSLWDSYVFSDIVTFPSLWEGWGNQFIEAVFAKKPVVIFEYPVFKSDIRQEGYKVISLGSKTLSGIHDLVKVPKETLLTAVNKTIETLTNKYTNEDLQHNFQVGKRYHSDKNLKQTLSAIIEASNK